MIWSVSIVTCVLILLSADVQGNLQITNGPRATSSVCINDKADIYCGFQGANPRDVEVLWYITRKNSHVMVVSGSVISTSTNGLQWVLDVLSGNDRSPNSKLIVGPVSEDDDQSTYQCSIGLPGETKINSATETLTVIGPPGQPSLMTGINDGASFQIVWNGQVDIACGSVTYHIQLRVAADERLIKQDTTKNQIYTFTGLSPDTYYTASVYGTNQAGDGQIAVIRVKTDSTNNNNNANNDNSGDDDNSEQEDILKLSLGLGLSVFVLVIAGVVLGVILYCKYFKED